MLKLNLFIIFVAICKATQVAGLLDKCTVTLKNGTINGWIAPTLNSSKKACVYFSIPYASPPVGPLRFQPPEPAKPWATPLNGSILPNWCPQKGKAPKGVLMSEDCLHLNVFQPINRSEDNLLPVLVWYHGGSFTSGSTYLYNPSRILSHETADVILVSVHYRLGLLGFLSTGDEISPGNYGLKDQALSIRWVHENIKAFGGNPNKITIFGESAGGASVIYQLISPLNKGLLSGVIAQSGTALSFWALDKNPADSARLMAKRLECPSNENQAMVTCLRKLPWQTIIKAQLKYTHEQFAQMRYPVATLIPVVEPKLPGAFISEEPEVLMRTGDIPDIPVIIGANKHDGSFILGILYFSKLAPKNLHKNGTYLKQDFVPDLLKFAEVKEESGGRGEASSLEMTYLVGVNRSNWKESMPGLVDLVSVLIFKSSIKNTVDILSRRNKNVYLYSFEHHSKNTVWPWYFGTKQFPVEGGIAHGDGW